MSFRLKIILILLILLFVLNIFRCIKSNKISIKYSLIWLFSCFFMIAIILIPNLLESISKILGFELISNMIFLIAIIVLFIVSFYFTVILTMQHSKITTLIQETSIIKSELQQLENKINSKEK